jgi:hypothetical protein
MRRLALLERQIEVERGVASAAQAGRARDDAKAVEVEGVLGREGEVTKANGRLEVMMRRYQEQRKEAQVGSTEFILV